MFHVAALTVAAVAVIVGVRSIRHCLRPGSGRTRTGLELAGWSVLLGLVVAAPTLYAQCTGRRGTWWNYADTAPEAVIAVMIIGLVAAIVCTVRLLVLVHRHLVDRP